jgi:DNA-directed RNA polymerase subunit RPC12/RpoP
MQISFVCSNCENEVRAAHSLAGRDVLCPYCDAKLKVPKQEDLHDTSMRVVKPIVRSSI